MGEERYGDVRDDRSYCVCPNLQSGLGVVMGVKERSKQHKISHLAFPADV